MVLMEALVHQRIFLNSKEILSLSLKLIITILNNEQCLTQLTYINVHTNEYIEELSYYSFAVKLDRWMKSCNILNDVSNEICVPNKTADLNLSVFNEITGINQVKILTKHT